MAAAAHLGVNGSPVSPSFFTLLCVSRASKNVFFCVRKSRRAVYVHRQTLKTLERFSLGEKANKAEEKEE